MIVLMMLIVIIVMATMTMVHDGDGNDDGVCDGSGGKNVDGCVAFLKFSLNAMKINAGCSRYANCLFLFLMQIEKSIVFSAGSTNVTSDLMKISKSQSRVIVFSAR